MMRDHAPPRTPPARTAPEQRRGGEAPSNGGPTAAAPSDPRAKERPAPLLAGDGAGTAATRAGAATDAGEPSGRPDTDAGERSGEEPAHPGVSLAPPGIIPESDVRAHSPAAAKPHHHLGIWAEELGELPWTYGDGRLVSLLRDPRTIFVYWDLSQQQIEQSFSGLGAARAVLKLWTTPQGGDFLREIEVHLEARGWYVRELPPGLDVRVELWAVGERGARMMRAARQVRLPPAEASNIWDEIYVNIPLGRRLGRGEPLTGGQPLQWRAGQTAAESQPGAPQPFLGASERLFAGPGRDIGGGSGSAGFFRQRPDQDKGEKK